MKRTSQNTPISSNPKHMQRISNNLLGWNPELMVLVKEISYLLVVFPIMTMRVTV
ncbi:MAG TPA: hypothetical protein VER14_01560 [Phototrophicaceae bacterium]|nr:hypothetical protein [Phototrophicaceae bacterium]